MKLSPHFTLVEMTQSQTATRLGIDNNPPKSVIVNLRQLVDLLEEVRALLGANSLIISSGYRSPSLNVRVGGASNSAHTEGRAADFICPAYGTPLKICQRISDAGLPFDKLIYEGKWVHIQIAKSGKEPRREVFTAHFGKQTTYTKGLS